MMMIAAALSALCNLAAAAQPCVPLPNAASGVCMPLCNNGDVMKHTPSVNDTTATLQWLEAGGRGVDTAWSYGPSQHFMGIALKQTKVPLSEIFLTTKIPCGATPADALALVKYDLDQLQLEKVGLILIHHPTSPACNSSDQIVATWQGLQTALQQGLTRSIGVSNFKPSDLQALAAAPSTKVTPAVNQISLHVGEMDNATIDYCKSKGIVIEGYSPLGHPDGGGKPVYELPEVVAIAKAHGRTGAQIALKWLVQQGWPYVTASPTLEYDKEDLDLFDFNLTASELATLNAVRL